MGISFFVFFLHSGRSSCLDAIGFRSAGAFRYLRRRLDVRLRLPPRQVNSAAISRTSGAREKWGKDGRWCEGRSDHHLVTGNSSESGEGDVISLGTFVMLVALPKFHVQARRREPQWLERHGSAVGDALTRRFCSSNERCSFGSGDGSSASF
ncbi:hypothetical protein VNO77_07685 [Canavalia gladiata]|uniref:Uncharacterized protein n=1 Tax=Canavalia gladiata TaxID=3824 RepID=A0AAN9QW97_CANGL